MRLLPLFLLVACEPGPNEETLVDSLQIVAATADPPEVAAFELYTLTATVVDPADEGFDVLMWTCVDDTCDAVMASVDGSAAAASLTSAAAIPGWIMACAPGVCDLQNPRPKDLRDPFSWLQDLPFDGVSLASWVPRITDGTADRHTNPLIEVEPDLEDLLDVRGEGSVKLDFTVPGAETAWTYTTRGGFRRPSEDVSEDGEVTVQWFAPKKSGDAELFVVFVDELGGSAVWQGAATVR